MNLELSELFGGFDTLAGKSKTLTVSGGFTKNNKHVEHKVVIGDITKNFVKNKMIEWDTFTINTGVGWLAWHVLITWERA